MPLEYYRRLRSPVDLSRRSTRRVRRLVPLALAMSLLLGGCATRDSPPEVRLKQGALSFGQLAIAIDDAERAVWDAQLDGYTAEDHDRVGLAVINVLLAARAFERAAATVPSGIDTLPEIAVAAETAVQAALDDLIAALPLLEDARAPILAAIAGFRLAITTWRAE